METAQRTDKPSNTSLAHHGKAARQRGRDHRTPGNHGLRSLPGPSAPATAGKLSNSLSFTVSGHGPVGLPQGQVSLKKAVMYPGIQTKRIGGRRQPPSLLASPAQGGEVRI